MKKLFYLVLAAVLFAVGCSESFDDSKIWNKLDDHENRISQLEELCKQMNTNISSLQTLVEAWNAQDYVTNVKMALDEDNQVIGYIITFKKSGPITIYHGKDGQNGTNGTTPIINVKKDSDGIFYWTLNGEWLLDDDGHKIKAVGTDGKDGQNGTDGEDGQDGATGPQGPVGEDGITPQFKIEDDYWHISYDNGRSWQKLNKAIGEDGKDGENGKDGDSFFQDVDSSNEDYIIFTLTNGTQFKIPTWAAYEKLQALCNQMNTNITSLQAIVDALNKKDYIASVSPFDQDGEEAGYKISFTSGKTITIYHGKDGQNGEDGKDGSTPIVGVKKDSDGIYYWTLNGEWLLDDDGHKIKAIGTDGEDGQNGQDGATGPQGPAGENGTDGKDGQNGADGKDGITPQLKIEDGKWYVSYDEGLSWKEVGQATGEQGEQGPQGAPGVGGDSMFTDIDYSTSSDYVVFTLSNGTEVKIPTWTAFEKLQTLCNQMNTNIAALQKIVDAINNNDFVKSITPIMDNGKEIGYTITFSKNGTITIYHGKDGQDGAIGPQGPQGSAGEDGQDGSTPIIGVKQFEGIYYWTVNGEWLLDSNGNKIKAQATDGATGPQGPAGENGTDGEDGKDGQNGADGKDGITPKLKIENGKWYVSYDEGDSWTELGQATGDKGEQGEAGNSFFKSVTQDENYVTFTLPNGTEFSILKASAVSSVKISYIPRYNDGKATVTYISKWDSSIEMDFQVMPSSVATIIAKNWQTTLSLKAVETQTRAVEYIDMPISKCTADATNGTITITASGKNLPAKFFSGAANVRAALFYNTAIGGTVSEYVELVAKQIVPANSSFDFKHVEEGDDKVLYNNGFYFKAKGNYQTYADGEKYSDINTRALSDFSVPIIDMESLFNVIAIDEDNVVTVLTYEQMQSAGLEVKFEFTRMPADGNISFDGNILTYRGRDKRVYVRGRLYQNGVELATSFDEGGNYAYFYIEQFNPLCDLSLNSSAPKAFEITEATRYVINVLDFFDLFESRDGSGYPYIWEDGSKVNLIDHSTGTWRIGNGTNGWYKNKTHTDIYGLTSEFELGEIPAEYSKYISWNETTGTLTFDATAGVGSVQDFTILVKLTVETPWSMSSAVAYITFIPKTTIPASRQIHYTATAKVEPYATNVFGANIVSNEWNSATGQGVITFDADVTKIGLNAFMYRSSLTTITIPDSVTTIGGAAFYDCSSLTTITIPDSVTTIEWRAFDGCSSLTSVTIGDSVTTIGDYAFSDCSSLTSVTIPDSVTTIGGSAFSGCRSLTNITIPNSVVKIGEYAFAGSGLQNFIFPTSLTYIGLDALNGCPIAKLECNVKNTLTIDEEIDYYHYAGIGSLPNLISIVGNYATNDNLCLIVNKHLVAFANKNISSYSITNDVESIDSWVFAHRKLESLTLHSNIYVYAHAFTQAEINTIIIPNGAYISDNAFYMCSSNTVYIDTEKIDGTSDDAYGPYELANFHEIYIGPNVKYIGSSAFDSVESVFCQPSTPPECYDPNDGNRPFGSVKTIYVPIGSGTAYKVAKGWSNYASIIVEKAM